MQVALCNTRPQFDCNFSPLTVTYILLFTNNKLGQLFWFIWDNNVLSNLLFTIPHFFYWQSK